MSFSSGTFYVFLQCENRQYLAAFPSRSWADKFWRIVLDLNNGSPSECRRFSAQFMSVPVLPNRMQVDDWDRQSCMVRAIGENNPLPIIPVDNRPDNINGGMYYIRSTLRPEYFWFFEPNTRQIGVSKVRQSRFMVQRAAALSYAVREEEDVLVGQDDVILSVALSGGQGQRVKIVSDHGGKLVQANGHSSNGWFKFWLFENGFQAAYTGEEGPVVAVGPSSGERWEFVA